MSNLMRRKPLLPFSFDDMFEIFTRHDRYSLPVLNNIFKDLTTGYDESLPINEYYEGDGTFVIEIAAAGRPKEDIKVEVQDQNLLISIDQVSEVITDDEEKDDSSAKRAYLKRKVSFRNFSCARSIPTNLDASKVSATHTDGLLIVKIPPIKEVKDQSRLIDIK